MSTTSERPSERGSAAHSATGKRRSPLGWLPWAALALLGVLGATAFLIARNVGDAGDEAGVDVVDDRAAEGQDPPGLDANANDGADSGGAPDSVTASTVAAAVSTPAVSASASPASNGSATTATAAATTAAGTASATSAPAATATAAAAPSGAASLTAGNQAILPLPAGGLAPLAGQPVRGAAVPVESVVADEGFWVGTSATDRVFIFLTPEARTSQGESPFQVQAGQSITLQGALIALPGAPDTLGVDEAEGAEQLRQQGHLVQATSVALS